MSIIDPLLGGQCERSGIDIMTRMTRADCAVMCNLINTYTHTHHAIQTRVVIIYISLSIFFIRDGSPRTLKRHRNNTGYSM